MTILDDLIFAQLTRRAIRVTGPAPSLGLVTVVELDADRRSVRLASTEPEDDGLLVSIDLAAITIVEITAMDVGTDRVL